MQFVEYDTKWVATLQLSYQGNGLFVGLNYLCISFFEREIVFVLYMSIVLRY